MRSTIAESNLILDPLTTAKQAFDNWRVNRNKREPIPKTLWALAVSLSGQYGFSQILKALKLNGSDFNKRLNTAMAVKKIKPMQFIECNNQILPMTPPARAELSSPCSIEFTCRNSSLVKLNGLSIADIQLVITQLMGGA